jgi:YgiT-type zinc finger domain-containing protein
VTKNESSIPQSYPCSDCQAGQMRRKYIAYLTWLGDELVTVPDFPAWVCDVCGRREYDANALNRLALILSPTAGKTHKKRKPSLAAGVSRRKPPRPSQPK